MRLEPFSGSYAPEDVRFLLRPIACPPTDIAEKEALIQSGQRHYSEMIAPEHPPADTYLRLYDAALDRNAERLAADIARLAAMIAAGAGGREVVLASLARAGTPIGVVLARVLRARGVPAMHYAVSIVRDRGIDRAALAHIAARHRAEDVVFVDGWTGKGAIAGELARSLADRPFGFAPRLAVVADPAGCAELAACADDYLIASGLLGSTVSGLVSRSILPARPLGEGEFHGCVVYPGLAAHDRSRSFVDRLTPLALATAAPPSADHAALRPQLRAECAAMVAALMAETRVGDRNRIKPGIAEATRALLRRVPDRLFVRDPDDPDLRHLLHLAAERGVPVSPLTCPGRYRAVAVIAGLGSE